MDQLEFIEKNPLQNYFRKDVEIQQYLSNKEPLTDMADRLGNVLSDVSDDDKYVISVLAEKRKKGYLVFQKPTEKIKIARAKSDLSDNFYLEISRVRSEKHGTRLNMNLVIQDFEIELRGTDVGKQLSLLGSSGEVDRAWFFSVAIKNCKFTSTLAYHLGAPLPLFFKYFRQIDFIDNEFSGTPVMFRFLGHDEHSSEKGFNVLRNSFKELTVFFDEDSDHIMTFGRRLDFIGNVVSDFFCVRTDNKNAKDRKADEKSAEDKKSDIRDADIRPSYSAALLLRNNTIRMLAFFDDTDSSQSISPEVHGEGLIRYKKLSAAIRTTSHSLNLDSGNAIEIMHLVGRCPEIVGFSLDEKIGDIIMKRFKDHAEAEREEGKSGAKEKIALNRNILSFLKKIAIDENRKILEQAMNYHISKLDRMILEIDGWRWSDRLISLAGWHLSRHSTSWFRPILWIVGVGLFFATIITWALGEGAMSLISSITDKTTLLLGGDWPSASLFVSAIFTLIFVAGIMGTSLFLSYITVGFIRQEPQRIWPSMMSLIYIFLLFILSVGLAEALEEVGSYFGSTVALLSAAWLAGFVLFVLCKFDNLRRDWQLLPALVFVIYLIVILGASTVGDDDMLYRKVLIELMYPLGLPSNIINSSSMANQEAISYSFPIFTVLFFSYKAFYAVCIFMFYRAAVRFIIK